MSMPLLISKGMYYAGIKLFSNLKSTIKNLHHNKELFKPGLNDKVLSYSF
jgi:hypothetical protein